MSRSMRFSLIWIWLIPAGAAAVPAYESITIDDVPHVLQRPDFCGEAAAEMVLRGLGYDIDQDEVFERSGLDPLQGRGCYTAELRTALSNIGFESGRIWYHVDAGSPRQLESQFSALHDDLGKGIPSIVCTRFDEQPDTTEHFRLVLGYDSENDEVIYHDPALEDGSYLRMKRKRFLSLWPLKYSKDRWTLIRFRMKPDRIEPARLHANLSGADFAQHIMELKKKIPSREFHIVIQRPFVVVGDESPERVEKRAKATVGWAVDRLKKDYFSKDPDHIIDIWLFKDEESYYKHTKEIFDDEPGTPFGYYSETERALIMNIATGGGTLVHEIVHPFMKANFPDCPAWFNEGMGSLYEQCGDLNGHINGYTNWRLADLQTAIRAGAVPSFKELTSTTEHEFYSEDPGTNYAQARYLCYYLQEKGKLVEFYRRFHANREEDPTGYRTLKEILGSEDMGEFKKEWEAFVLKLRFP